ncbi:MAG: SAM-dependent chlorinase/fluorinase [Flavipsychrobacter sp.]|nr:SAM-dependent chlorinase/fluorinase [Flavipsychrobacter sp.]
MARIITLLSDLGTRDGSVARIKAAITQRMPHALVTDICHHVPRHDRRETGYLLADSCYSYPSGTIHVVLTGMFMDKENPPALLLAMHGGHYFILPDNGILSGMPSGFAPSDALLIARFSRPYSTDKWLQEAINAMEAIETGATDSFTPVAPYMLPPLPAPQVTPVGIACRILRRDRYNNLVLNLRKEEFDQHTSGRPFRIRTFRSGLISAISNHYSDVPLQSPLCRFNKLGFLEIAVNHGAATDLFGIDATDAGALDYHTIRISY